MPWPRRYWSTAGMWSVRKRRQRRDSSTRAWGARCRESWRAGPPEHTLSDAVAVLANRHAYSLAEHGRPRGDRAGDPHARPSRGDTAAGEHVNPARFVLQLITPRPQNAD